MEKKLFDRTDTGEEIYAYTLQNGDLSATILTYGGILQSFRVGDKDIVCGFDTYANYVLGGGSHGALVGRYANRIADGRFVLNGKTYQLEKNEKERTHIHGGKKGFGTRLWEAVPAVAPGYEAVALKLSSPHMDAGYPGNLEVIVTYLLSETGLCIHYEADSDADTVLNLTNHAYFNLKGYDGGTALDHILQIDADAFTAVNDWSIPVETRPVAGTPFDFTVPHAIGDAIEMEYDQLRNGYDHNFWLNGKVKENLWGRELTRAAVLSCDGLTMTCYTDKPCVQLYTANSMGKGTPFKGGVKAENRNAVCLETQYAPDSPNHGQAFLKAGEHYDFITAYMITKA